MSPLWGAVAPKVLPSRQRPIRWASRAEVPVEDKSLRRAGLKVTAPRLKILEIFENSPTRHLAADDIYRVLLDADADIGLATVYRVLTQFESAGLLSRRHFEEGTAVFESRTSATRRRNTAVVQSIAVRRSARDPHRSWEPSISTAQDSSGETHPDEIARSAPPDGVPGERWGQA